MITFDSQKVQDSGAFLVGELERLDSEMHLPLVSVSWHRDIDLREDVTIADEASAFTTTSLAAMGSASTTGKNWISDKSTAINGISINTDKHTQPMNLWGMEAAWSIPELLKGQLLKRPIDSQKNDGIKLKHNMDVDEQVYIGDKDLGIHGLVNNPDISPLGYSGEWTEATSALQILGDINDLLNEGYRRSGYTICPDRVGLHPGALGFLTKPVTSAGSESILEYVMRKCLCKVVNGRDLTIVPMKYLKGAGVSKKNRAMAYTKNKQFVRFPMVPLQRTPLEHRGIHQVTTYFGTLGEVEFVYPETVTYADGL